ncbi:MAG: CHAT domain-containing tetratricopeptide repeat protein [Saprospiraceae bacterium]|nr:CHAT domain-containing tetratricopeptide repeat protein [Saprospiraceae bacterium]
MTSFAQKKCRPSCLPLKGALGALHRLLLAGAVLLSATLYGQRTTDSLAAQGLMKEADALFSENNYEAAAGLYRQAQASWASMEAWESSLNATYRLANTQLAQRNCNSANEEADYGLRNIDEHLAGRHPLYARLLFVKAECRMQQQRFNDALPLLQTALQYMQHYFPDRKTDMADAHTATGRCYGAMGDAAAALPHFDAARLLLEGAQSAAERQLLCSALINVATAHVELHRLPEAQHYYEAAIAIAEPDGLKEYLSYIWYYCAYIHMESGNPDAALGYLLKSESMMLDLYGPDYPELGPTYTMIGSAYGQSAWYEESLAYFQKALTVSRNAFGDVHPYVADALINIGQLHYQQRRYDEASASLSEALRILNEVFPHPHPLKTVPRELIARIYLDHRHAPDTAQTYAQALYDENMALFGLRHPSTSGGLLLLGRCALAAQDVNRAIQLTQQALVAASAHFDSPNPTQNPSADDLSGNEAQALDVLALKSSLLFEQWKKDRLPETEQVFMNCLTLGETLLRRQAGGVFEATPSDLGTADTRHHFLKNALRITASRYAVAPSMPALSRCFRWMELNKAQRLRTAVQSARAPAFAQLPDSILHQEALWSEKIRAFQQHLLSAVEAADSTGIRMWRDDSLFYALRQRADFERMLEREYPAYFRLTYQAEPVSLDQLQQRLPAGTLLLEIALGTVADSCLYLLAVGPQNSTLLQIPVDIASLEKEVYRLHALLQSPAISRLPRRREYISLAHALYRQLLAPMEAQLAGAKQLIVCGEAFTHLLPFESLLAAETDRPVHELNYLIRRMAVSYHYSATMLCQTAPRPAAGATASEILAFAPVFSGKIPAGQEMLSARRDSSLRALDADGRWTALPFSEEEVKQIATLFASRRPGSATVLLHEQAQKPDLVSALTHRYRFVHIASHSFANNQTPKLSGIACFSPDSVGGDVLRAGELYALKTTAELVTLSSCESGLGRAARGEGLLGLNRALLYSGTPNVAYSLWKVNDRATADLMVRFYQSLLNGQTYTEALRAAKLDMIREPATAAPCFWGGFVGIFAPEGKY